MAIFEQLGQMTYIDAIGDQHILYPFTKKECVEGLFKIEDSIGNLNELETDNKSNLVEAINEARGTGGNSVPDIQEAINIALTEAKQSGEFDGRGIVSIVRTSGTGAAGTVDTYTITYTDDSTSTFNVYNGANGSSGESGPSVSGENGATFTPHVDSDGNLSWSNDKGLANPATVNIKGYTPVKGKDYFDGKDGKDGDNGKDGYTPQKGVDYFDGEDGKDGKDGYSPKKGVDYFDGADGVDGISVTHKWDGTTLSVTSASGTTSANLVGPSGADGVGIASVKQTTTSTTDGGDNIITVTFTNNQTDTFSIKNGSKGSNGNTGAPGSNATINGVNTLTLDTGTGLSKSQVGNKMTISANYEYGTTDLTAGSSHLETGKLYFVYE